MNRIFKLFCMAVVFLSITSIACSENTQDRKTKETISKVENAMGSIQSFKQITITYEKGTPIAEAVKYWEAPNKYNEATKLFIDNKTVEGPRSVSDGSFVWTYTPMLNSVTKQKSPPGEKVKENILTKDENGIYAKLNFVNEDEGHYIFEVVNWHDDPKIFRKQKTVTYYRKDIGYPDKLVFYDGEDNERETMIISYSDINKSIDDNMFKFTPPNDVNVMDLNKQKGPFVKERIAIEGKKTEPDRILDKEEIIKQASNLAKAFGFDIEKCDKTATKNNGKWEVILYNKNGVVGRKKITQWFNKHGYPLGMHRSPD